MTRWEYRVDDMSAGQPEGDAMAYLDQMGAEGWELAGVSRVGFAGCEYMRYFFKRVVR